MLHRDQLLPSLSRGWASMHNLGIPLTLHVCVSSPRSIVSPIVTQPGGAQVTLRPYAIASLIIYTFGIPLAFGSILYFHRREIEADQKLKEEGDGNTPSSNPNYYIRTRYQELYVLFRPGTAPPLQRRIRCHQQGEPERLVADPSCVGVCARHGVLASGAHCPEVLHHCGRAHVQLQPAVPGLVCFAAGGS